MKTIAAVLVQPGKPLVLTELEIPSLKPGQALVEIQYSGVCHTQVLECRGYRGEDRYLPHCLGHEGTGIIRDIGRGVTKVKVGNPVILSWIKGSGADVPGTVYKWDERDVNAGAITTFSRYSIISENRLTVMPDGLSMKDAVLLGCAVPTGVGAVFNTARAGQGQSIAIFGVGGVGLCAVNGSAIAGCQPIIAVDILESRLKLAKEMGATHCVHADEVDPVEEINRICACGVDFSIEASGRPEVMLQALYSVHRQGGVAIIIGNAMHGERVNLDPGQLNLGKQLRGTWGGDTCPDRDFPSYCQLISSGKLDAGRLTGKTYCLIEINDAINDLESGKVIRPLVDMTVE